jgi:protein-tyrosine phosphatase
MYPIKQVTDYIWRGPRPKYYDILTMASSFHEGITRIIDLENDSKITQLERTACNKYGITLIDFPMSEFFRPSFTCLDTVADWLDNSTIDRKKTLIHCKHGQDRTGYAVMAYRIKYQGWTVEQAMKECRENGHKWFFYLYWRKSIYEFAKEQNKKEGL